MSAPRLEAFRTAAFAPHIVPCTSERSWIDRLAEAGAAASPPVSLANTHGWELLVPAAFEIEWNGGPAATDLVVRGIEPFPDDFPPEQFAASHAGLGIVSFNTGYLFRTPPGWNLLATGAFNEPRAGVAALTGIVETSATNDPLIMPWLMLAPGIVRFEADQVFCTVIPIQANVLEAWEFAIHDLGDDPSLVPARDHIRDAWKTAGTNLFGFRPGNAVENTGLKLNPPVDRTGTRPTLAPDSALSPTVSKWRPDSLLNSIDHDQNNQNIEGRRRLREGTLFRSPATAIIVPEPDLDASAFDFIYESAFLTPAECALLTETAQDLAARQQSEGIEDTFWKGRFLQFGDVLLRRPGSAALMREAQSRVTQRLRAFYELTAPIFADTAALVRWRTGMFMDPHADRASPDGGYHGFPHRDFGSIVYINDDYEGGELYFPRLDLVVKPTLGLLVAFTGGWHHEHAVLKVRSKDRLTMSAFYSFDASHRERDVYGLGPLG